jgi:hypothetical protein
VRRQKKDTSQAGELNFKLSPRVDVMRLSSAEIDSLLPNNEELVHVRSSCQTCHGFQTVLRNRGFTAEEWADYLPRMSARRFGSDGGFGNPERVALFAPVLEKCFGPAAPYFGPDAEPPSVSQIKHAEPVDAALRATITEYELPYRGALAHSLTVDSSTGTVWFSSYDVQNNNLTRFDPGTETFQVFPVPVAKSNPHTGTLLTKGWKFHRGARSKRHRREVGARRSRRQHESL